MKRTLRRIAVLALTVVLGTAALLEAQSTGLTDTEVQGFVLPGTALKGMRVHGNRSHMSLALPYGNIIARGGYKIPYTYSHGDQIKASVSAAAMPITGTPKQNVNASGVAYQRAPYAGSVIAIAVGTSTAITAGSVTAEATILRNGAVVATG